MTRKPLHLVLLAAALSSACSSAEPGGRLDAVLWMRTSAEREALCMQAFHCATLTLDRALADPNWSACVEQGPVLLGKPPAVICDVDDTLLSDSEFQRLELLSDEDEPPSFVEWVQRSDAPALPGAADFLQAASDRGITVFYVTNRAVELLEPTRRNLAAAGFPLRNDIETVLCLRDNPDKGPRRAAIGHDYRVLLILGDNAGDFSSTFTGLTPAERRGMARKTFGFWGERWFILPNPAFGDWKRAILGWKSLDLEDQEDEMLDYLDDSTAEG